MFRETFLFQSDHPEEPLGEQKVISEVGSTERKVREPRTLEEQLKGEIIKTLDTERVISDTSLVNLIESTVGEKPKIFYHATRPEEFQKLDQNYFDRDSIVLIGSHFSYKADNLSYGGYDMSKLVEFRVIDIGQELKDTAETGEGSVVGHEAIALRPVVLRKLDDRFYTPDEIAAQSELPDGYYGFPQGENKGEDIRVRQITYVIDRNATEKGDIAEFLKDPAFALKYLNEDILTRTKYPADWMDERSAEELTRLYELDETRFKQSEVVKSFRRAKLRSAAWFHKALAKEERVVRVMARERIGWQEKTDRVLEKVVPHESFVKFYLDEYLPYLLSDDGFYDITEKDLKIEQENAIRKLRQYGFSSSSSVEGLY